tara:strand:+ start:4258 stop:4446 length:189 start_codon:yes stop_codon:yes gene_type:complete
LPVERWFEVCVGMMHLSPECFWNMSIKEITMAINGFKEYNGNNDKPMEKSELEDLKEMYPDC